MLRTCSSSSVPSWPIEMRASSSSSSYLLSMPSRLLSSSKCSACFFEALHACDVTSDETERDNAGTEASAGCLGCTA